MKLNSKRIIIILGSIGLLLAIGSAILIVQYRQDIKNYFGVKEKPKVVVPPVTIWIHGTNLKTVVPRWMHKLIPARYQSRSDEVVSELIKATDLKQKSAVYKAAKLLADADSKDFDLNNFYLFRWSGSLDEHARENAAVDLYCMLSDIVRRMEFEYGGVPKITIIAHSHGGNVALSLAKVYDKENTKFKIDKLILLACPVILSTKNLVLDPFIKQVYSLYSNWDWVQVMDPQGMSKGGFSGRTFPLSPKLKQASVQKSGRGLYHMEFKDQDFIKLIPSIISLMGTKNSGHCSINPVSDEYLVCINNTA